MPYALVSDVKNYFLGYSFSATANLSEAKIQFHLNGEESFINNRLSSIADVPITDTADLKLIVQIHAKLVAGTVDEMVLNSDGKSSGADLTKKRNLRKEALELLDDIINRKVYINSTSKTLMSDGKEDLRYENLPICKSNALPDNPDCEDCGVVSDSSECGC